MCISFKQRISDLEKCFKGFDNYNIFYVNQYICKNQLNSERKTLFQIITWRADHQPLPFQMYIMYLLEQKSGIAKICTLDHFNDLGVCIYILYQMTRL